MAGKPESFSEEENRALREALKKFARDNNLKQAGVGRAIGIKQQNAGRLLGPSPHVGMGRKTANLLAVKLGYRDAEHFLREHGVLAGSKEIRTGNPWHDRDSAIRWAKLLKIDDGAVQAVVARYARDADQLRQAKWWVGKFRDEEIERAAEALEPQQLPEPIRPVQPKRAARTRKKEGTHG